VLREKTRNDKMDKPRKTIPNRFKINFSIINTPFIFLLIHIYGFLATNLHIIFYEINPGENRSNFKKYWN